MKLGKPLDGITALLRAAAGTRRLILTAVKSAVAEKGTEMPGPR